MQEITTGMREKGINNLKREKGIKNMEWIDREERRRKMKL